MPCEKLLKAFVLVSLVIRTLILLSVGQILEDLVLFLFTISEEIDCAVLANKLLLNTGQSSILKKLYEKSTFFQLNRLSL